MHHIRLKTHKIHKNTIVSATKTKKTQVHFPYEEYHQRLIPTICAVTYVGGGEDQQRPPRRDQHLGLCEVTDTLFLQLNHMAHKRLYILGPVLISPGSRKLLHPLLQRRLQSTAGTTDLMIKFEMGSVIKRNEQFVVRNYLTT